LLVSGVSGEGVTTLMRAAYRLVRAARQAAEPAPEPEAWRP